MNNDEKRNDLSVCSALKTATTTTTTTTTSNANNNNSKAIVAAPALPANASLTEQQQAYIPSFVCQGPLAKAHKLAKQLAAKKHVSGSIKAIVNSQSNLKFPAAAANLNARGSNGGGGAASHASHHHHNNFKKTGKHNAQITKQCLEVAAQNVQMLLENYDAAANAANANINTNVSNNGSGNNNGKLKFNNKNSVVGAAAAATAAALATATATTTTLNVAEKVNANENANAATAAAATAINNNTNNAISSPSVLSPITNALANLATAATTCKSSNNADRGKAAAVSTPKIRGPTLSAAINFPQKALAAAAASSKNVHLKQQQSLPLKLSAYAVLKKQALSAATSSDDLQSVSNTAADAALSTSVEQPLNSSSSASSTSSNSSLSKIARQHFARNSDNSDTDSEHGPEQPTDLSESDEESVSEDSDPDSVGNEVEAQDDEDDGDDEEEDEEDDDEDEEDDEDNDNDDDDDEEDEDEEDEDEEIDDDDGEELEIADPNEARGRFLLNAKNDNARKLSALFEAANNEKAPALRHAENAIDETKQVLTKMRGGNGQRDKNQANRNTLIAACSDNDVKTVRRLLGKGVNVNEPTDDGESLLSMACSAGYYELAQVSKKYKSAVKKSKFITFVEQEKQNQS